MARKLINMNVDAEVLARIDEAAHAAKLTRTAYMIARSDPGDPELCRIEPTPKPSLGHRSATVVAASPRRRVEVEPHSRAPVIGYDAVTGEPIYQRLPYQKAKAKAP